MRREAISSALEGGSRSISASRVSQRASLRDDSTYPDDDCQVESLKDQARTTHEEARMVLPGIQALFGFQLIAVFNRRFIDLDALNRGVYLASLVLIAVAIGLIMAPAAYHRLVERDRV